MNVEEQLKLLQEFYNSLTDDELKSRLEKAGFEIVEDVPGQIIVEDVPGQIILEEQSQFTLPAEVVVQPYTPRRHGFPAYFHHDFYMGVAS